MAITRNLKIIYTKIIELELYMNLVQTLLHNIVELVHSVSIRFQYSCIIIVGSVHHVITVWNE